MIDSISQKPLKLQSNPALKTNDIKSSPKQIAKSFEKMFDEVNNQQLDAEHKINEMVAGRNKDIPGTIVAMEKADVSTKMLMAVRNKIVNAYEEVMRMQV